MESAGLAAVDELGVMVAQYAFVEDDLRTGRLIAPLVINVRTPRGYFLATHPDRQPAEHVLAFETWILNEAALSESHFP